MPAPRLFIVDPHLQDYGGHHYEYCRSVAEAAQELGLSPVVLANRKFSLTDTGAIPHDPVFRFPQFSKQANAWRIDLRRALDAHGAGAEDHVFIHTLYMDEMEQLSALLEFTPFESMPHVHLMLRRDLEEYGLYEEHFLSGFCRRLNVRPELAARLHFYADTDGLCRQYETFTAACNKPVARLPIPQRHAFLEPGAAKPPDRRLRIAYPGDARNEKGYAFLPQAIKYVQKHMPGRAEFVIQSGFNIPGGETGMASARKALQQTPGVSCPEGPFAPDVYYRHLRDADIILLPYDPRAYRRRSSGPLSEALGAGKVTVVPARCWLAEQVDGARAVVFPNYARFGPAICKAIADFEKLGANARAYSKTYLQKNTPALLVQTLLDQSRAPWSPASVSGPAKKKALVVCESWVVDPFSGSSRAGACQIRYFREQGYEVQVLVRLDIWTPQFPTVDYGQIKQCEEFCARHGAQPPSFAWFPAGWNYSRAPGAARGAAAVALERNNDADFQSELWVREAYEIDPSFCARIAGMKIDVVLMNYAWNFPLLDKLGLKGAPVICDTHDDMARLKAVARGEARPDPEEEKLDIELLARCQGVSFVSAEEQNRFAPALPKGVATAHVVPVDFSRPDPETSVAGCTNMVDVVRAAGPVDVRRVEPLGRQLENEIALDLFMVSSNHMPTRKSLGVFYEEVFVPHLKPRGLKLTIAGTLTPPGEIPASEAQIRFLGRVRDLTPLYAASRVVIIPLYFGTGTAIKTLEALRYGRAMIGTPLAFRGHGEAFLKQAAPLIAATPEDFAEQITALLSDPLKRKQRAMQALEIARGVPGWREFSARMSELMQQAAPGFTPRPPAPEESSPGPAYFEMDSGVLRFNIILRMLLLDMPPTPEDCRRLLDDLKDPAAAALMRRMFDSFCVTRAAPLARLLEPAGFFMQKVAWDGDSFDDFAARLESRTAAAA